MRALRLDPPETDDSIRRVLAEGVRRSGLPEAYVAMDCLRGTPRPGQARHPVNCRNFAIPWLWVVWPEVQARGAHLVIAKTPRISGASVDPTVKNFHWGDFTRGLFEAYDQGADNCVLLDSDDNVTEGPGFNVLAVTGGSVATPDSGVLEGVTRLSVEELCHDFGISFTVSPLPASEPREADEIFLATTAGGIMPAARLDARILGDDRPGPISSRPTRGILGEARGGMARNSHRL
jgi:branched-chain amino acid aminotransferase